MQALKRLFIVGTLGLLVTACSEPLPSDTLQNTPQAEPLLTLPELLNADDVKQSLAQASKQGDQQAIAQWQERLLEAAEQVNLLESEVNLLSGEQGRVFLAFQGMKTNYQNEFERAFFEFGNVDAVYERYPAFESLHQQSKDLVEKRDALIQSSAKRLESQGLSPDDATKQARLQWQAAMQQP